MDDAEQTATPGGVAPWPILDRIAAWVGVLVLKRLFGADCQTDVPGETDIHCLGCDAKRLVDAMQDIVHDR